MACWAPTLLASAGRALPCGAAPKGADAAPLRGAGAARTAAPPAAPEAGHPKVGPAPAGGSAPANRGACGPPTRRGEALGARLGKLPAADGRRRRVTLGELRGSTGALVEGPLKDASPEGIACCIGPFAGAREAFYAVKGPWMLKFKGRSNGARCVGAPIPLDGAEARAIGDTELEITNCHIKDAFLGKGLSDLAGDTFVHSVQVCLEARSQEARDEWVRVLQAQIARLAESHARRAAAAVAAAESGCVVRAVSCKTTGTAAAVNSLASRIFADFEEEEEFAVLGRHRPDLVSPFPGTF